MPLRAAPASLELHQRLVTLPFVDQCHMLVQAPADPKATDKAKPKAARLSQGNMNRLVHLMVLHDLGMDQEASQFIQGVLAKSPPAAKAYTRTTCGGWQIMEVTQTMGTSTPCMATVAGLKRCIA